MIGPRDSNVRPKRYGTPCRYLLVELIFETITEKVKEMFLKIPFFEGGGEIHSPLVPKGLRLRQKTANPLIFVCQLVHIKPFQTSRV